MKISNIVTTGILAVGACAAVGLGVGAIAGGTNYTNNNISYQLNDKKCFVKIVGSYSGPALTVGGSASYEDEYNENDLVAGNSATLAGWNIGNVQMDSNNYSFTITLHITNLGKRDPIDDLDVSVSNIAANNANEDADKLFTTEVTLDDAPVVLQRQTNTTSKVQTFVVKANATRTLKLKYTMKVFNQRIDNFQNNVSIVFDRQDTE